MCKRALTFLFYSLQVSFSGRLVSVLITTLAKVGVLKASLAQAQNIQIFCGRLKIGNLSFFITPFCGFSP